MKLNHDWNALKTEFVTGDITASGLAKKYGISYGTVLRHSQIEHWKEMKEEYLNSVMKKCADNAACIAAITLTKELDIANRLSEVLLEASKDEKQFNRHLIKGKDATEEIIFDKVDMDSLNNAIKALKSLEEIKRVMNEVISPVNKNQKEDRQETGIVILPDIEEDNNEA